MQNQSSRIVLLRVGGSLNVMSGEVLKEAATKDNAPPRTLVLFNDLLLCALKTANNKLKVRQVVNVINITIETDLLSLPPGGFRIRTDQVVMDVIAEDDAERDAWVDCIKETLNDLAMLVKNRQFILEENSKLERVETEEIVDDKIESLSLNEMEQ